MPKKLRFKIELLGLFIKKNWLIIVLGALLGLGLSFAVKPLVAYLKSPALQTERIGQIGAITLKKLPTNVRENISYGLTKIDETTKRIVPSPLVKSITLSEDRQKYTVVLKENNYWHDGKEVTAYDINYSITGVTITPINKYTLTIAVDTPYAGLLSLFTQPLIKNDTTGNGPYKVASFQFQEGYLKKLRLINTTASKPALEYYFYLNSKDALTGLKLGEVDTVDGIEEKANLINWPNTQIENQLDTKKYVAIFLNTDKFASKRIRQALAYATPKFSSGKDRALSPLEPTSWAYNPEVKAYDFNPARAKELWKGEEHQKIQLLVNDRNLVDVATEIQKVWQKELGITVDVVTRNESTSLGDFDALLAASSIPLDPDQYTFWHSTQKVTNITHLNFAPIDKLLEEGRVTFDILERKKIYYEFQKILTEESPAIFLYYPTQYSITRIK